MSERIQSQEVFAVSIKDKLKRLVILEAARHYIQYKKIPNENRDFILDEILPSVLIGQKRSLAGDAEILLSHHEVQVDGTENIPSLGPVLIVANHWGKGPLARNGTHLAISREVTKRRADSGNVAWIINGNLHLSVSGIPMPFSSRYCSQTAEAYSQHIVNNGGNLHSGIKIIQDFRRGGAIGLYPETEWSTHLKNGSENAGALVCALARTEGLICPAGVYSDLSDKLFVRFGTAINTSEIRQRSQPLPTSLAQRDTVYRRVAELLMGKIDPLVHPKYRHRSI